MAGSLARRGSAAPVSRRPSILDTLAKDGERYRVGELLGMGGEARVYLALDRQLRRGVAMKILRADRADDRPAQERFLAEARRTASLTHPGIPQVFDMGRNREGDLYFTMSFADGETLKEILGRIRKGDPRTCEAWPLDRLCQVLRRIAVVLEYAHGEGLVHRDVKPSNVWVGYEGVIVLLDWGTTRRLESSRDAFDPRATGRLAKTVRGTIKGSPPYMSPEQALGTVDLHDRRTDVFGLGGLLFEILSLRPPYVGETFGDLVTQARKARIERPSTVAGGRPVPSLLEDVAMKALTAYPRERYQSAREFAEALDEFLATTEDRSACGGRTKGLMARARQVAEESRLLLEEAKEAEAQADRLAVQLPPWAESELKRPIWQLQDQADELRVGSNMAHAHALDLGARTLADDPDDRDGRELMAKLYCSRLREALDPDHRHDAVWLRRMAELYNDGSVDEALSLEGSLTVATLPAGARVRVARLVDQDRRLRPEPFRNARSPAAFDQITAGGYVVHVSLPGYLDAQVPAHVSPGRPTQMEFELVPEARAPAGFLWVPGGVFRRGPPEDLEEVELPGFLIGRRPVLLSEYADWLDRIGDDHPDATAGHLPRVPGHGPLLRVEDGRHVYCPPLSDVTATAPIRDVLGLPVVGISRTSARAYARWLSLELRFPVALPTELQWEKAARGTDARCYPWGDHFDATFASSAESTEPPSELRPVGWSAADVSPYGVLDMAGNVREWCADDVAEGRYSAVCRGGAWHLYGPKCTVYTRWPVGRSARSSSIGLRLVIDLRRS